MNTLFKKASALMLSGILFTMPFAGIAEAKHHRVAGTDYPYDAADYYSRDSISWADSAPSKFALRDLAANGGTVYDYTRHMKSILFGNSFVQWLGIISAAVSLAHLNIQHILKDPQDILIKHTTTIAENTAKGDATLDPDPTVNPVYPHLHYTKGVDDISKTERLNYLFQRYNEIAEKTKEGNSDTEEIMQAVADAKTALNNARGEMEANQAYGQIKAYEDELKNRTNTNLANYASIKALAKMREDHEADQLEGFHQHGELNFVFYDPYNKSLYNNLKEKGYEVKHIEHLPDF